MCRCAGIFRISLHTSLCEVSLFLPHTKIFEMMKVFCFSIAEIIGIWIFPCLKDPLVAGCQAGGSSPWAPRAPQLCVATAQNQGEKNRLGHRYKVLWNSPFNWNLAVHPPSSRPACSAPRGEGGRGLGHAGWILESPVRTHHGGS